MKAPFRSILILALLCGAAWGKDQSPPTLPSAITSSVVVTNTRPKLPFALSLIWDAQSLPSFNVGWWTTGSPTQMVTTPMNLITLTNLPRTNRIFFLVEGVDSNGIASPPAVVSFSSFTNYNIWKTSCGTNVFDFTSAVLADMPSNPISFFRAAAQTNLLQIQSTTNLVNPVWSLFWLTLPPAGTKFPTNVPPTIACVTVRTNNP